MKPTRVRRFFRRPLGGLVAGGAAALILCVSVVAAVAGTSTASAADPGLPAYAPPADFEQDSLTVWSARSVVALAEQLARDLGRRLPGLDIRVATAPPGGPESASEVVLTRDPSLGERSRPALGLRHRWDGEPRQIALGYDAIIALGRRGDPVIERGLSVAELASTFAAGRVRGLWRIRNWPQIDGRGVERDAVEIQRVIPAGDDPLLTAFREAVLRNDEVDAQIARVSDPGGVGAWVAAHEGSLGVTRLSAWQGEGAQVPLAWDPDEGYIAASSETLRAHSYPLIMPLRLYVPGRQTPLTPALEEWVAYLLSDAGQAILADAGYVPVTGQRAATQRRWLGLARD